MILYSHCVRSLYHTFLESCWHVAALQRKGGWPVQAVQVMRKICQESEASLDYYSLFKAIMKKTPVPMSPLESLASSAVRTAHKVPP